tara:strand:- start:25342 stop:27309 length:1968 start_codon:yes stop_codon:yes gene_type:complete
MAIKKYLATKDNTITNAFELNRNVRATGSNMGASDILEVFSIYGQSTTSSVELSRVLVEFPISSVSADRAAGKLPASGSARFYLRMFNARHSEQLPRDYTFNVLAVSQSWQEGYGLDMESYSDKTKDRIQGSNWFNANNNLVAAKLINAIDCSGVSNDHTFTLTSPTAMGGDGVTYTFKFVHDVTAVNAGAAGNIYYIARDGLTDAQRAAACADAINGTANVNVAFSNGDASSVNTTDLKIKATAPGTGGGATIDLEFDNPGIIGNGHANVLAATNGFTGTKILEDAFTGGDGRWANIGGDYHISGPYVSGSTMPKKTFTFNDGDEDLIVDVTPFVEEWIDGNKSNYGFGVFLTSSFEGFVSNSSGLDGDEIPHNPDGAKKSFYTKRFFSRTSEFFFKRPVLEARWDSRISDDRGYFFSSSSLAPASDNLNNLYLYNYIRGNLVDIPRSETITVSLYSSSLAGSPTGDALATATASKISTGVYKAQISINTTSSVLNDVWSGSIGGEYKTGSIKVNNFNNSSVLMSDDFTTFNTKITNLRSKYSSDEQARFRVFTRPRNFSPTIYTVANTELQKLIVPSASFEIFRSVDNHTVINNSTGSSTKHTYLSYDNSGSYFDLDMSLLEPGYMYGIRLYYHSSGEWRRQRQEFKFRVEDI